MFETSFTLGRVSMSANDKISVLLADDHQIMRQGLCLMIPRPPTWNWSEKPTTAWRPSNLPAN
ncbi:MAG: hypothetical protein ACPGVU_01255 [Limisphaerales bacterium]